MNKEKRITTIQLYDMDSELYKDFKIIATIKDTTISTLVKRFIKQYVENNTNKKYKT